MRKCTLEDAMREELIFDDNGFIKHWGPCWEHWPDGEQGHNVNVWDEQECPVCLDRLFMVRKPNPEDIGASTVWVCLSCGTQYLDMLSNNQRANLIEHLAELYHQTTTPRKEAPTRPPISAPLPEKPVTATVDILKRYRNLIK